MKPKLTRVLPSAAFFAFASPAFAATWIGTDNTANNFNTGGNWSPSGVPGNTTEIIIGSGGTVNLSGGLNRAANTTLGGSLTISGNLNNHNGTNTNSTFTVNSGAAFTQTGGNYFIGAANGGTGTTTFTQVGGSVNVTALRGFQVSDGNGTVLAGRSAQYSINGGTFNATLANDTIAEIYNGFLAGRAGGTTPDSFTVAGGAAILSVPGTALTRRFTLTNGASVNVSSGSLSFNGFAENRLGYDDTNIAGTSGSPGNSATSKVTVSGGSLTFAMGGTSPFFDLGATPGYNGAIDVIGGTLNFTGGRLNIGSGGANGIVTQTGGALTVNDFILIGRKDSNTSGGTDIHLNLNGGTLSTSSIRSGGGTISATNNNVVANGGTIKALVDTADFLQIGTNGATPLNNVRPYVKIESGGLTFDTNGHNVGIQTALHAGDNSGGGLTKTGSGTLSLAGFNTYTGATNVNNGTLQVVPFGSFAGPCNVAIGATLAVRGDTPDFWSLPDLSMADGSSFTVVNLDPQVFFGPVIEVANVLSLAGTVTLNISGVLSPGDYPLISFGTLSGGGSFLLGSLPRGTSADLIPSENAVVLHVGEANPLIWKGNVNSTWDINTTSNWTLGGSPDKYMENDNVVFDDSATSTTVSLAATVSPGSVTFDNDSNYTLEGTGFITGAAGLTKGGSGTLIIATANTLTGATTVNEGTLQFGNGTAEGSVGGAIHVNDANVIFNTAVLATTAGPIEGIPITGQLTKTGPGKQVFLGTANTYAGPFAISQGTVEYGNGVVGLVGTGTSHAIASGATLRLNYAVASTVPWSTTSGAGVLSLNSAQPVNATAAWGRAQLQGGFTGTLRVEKGRVDCNGGIADLGGTSKVEVLSGAQLLCFSSASPYAAAIDIAGTGWGEAGYPGGLRLASSGTATWSGPVTLTADSGIMAQRLANFTVTGAITGNFLCEFYAGDPSGDSGTLTITPSIANSYGSTRINGRPSASVVAGNANAFSQGPLEVVNAILKLNGNSFTFASLSGAGGVVGNYGSVPAVLTAGNAADTSYAGVLRDGGTGKLALVKTGVGSLTLTGANIYTGATTVNAGTLSINSAYLDDSATVSIAAGAHLNLATGTTMDTVGALILGGTTVPGGTYNSSHPTYGSYFTGTGSLVVVAAGYSSWAAAGGLVEGNNSPGDDPDKDGINNLAEFYLDGNPLASSSSVLPVSALNPVYLTLSFKRRDDAEADIALQVVEYGSGLGSWTPVTLGVESSGPDANGVIVTVTENFDAPDDIVVQVPRALASDGRFFARLRIIR